MQDIKVFASDIRTHLTETIIPFWKGLRDETYGGYYGWLGYDLMLDKKAVKGCILNSRILWFFSNAYLLLGEKNLLEEADHAWQFLRDYCVDRENGGVYWSLTYDGKPEDLTKHTYNQAFAIYALSSYYDASGDEEALELAQGLYHLIETKCKDEYGYLEAFNVRFEPEDNDKLSENGVMAEKTMNTLLHVFEAYTELYRVTKAPEVGENIRFMLDIIKEKVYNPKLGRQEVFFNRTWNSLIDLYSYGHDIETAWLVDRGLDVLDDAAYKKRIRPITKEITKNIYDRAYIGHSLANEAENGVVDTTRVWWVQAEAVVGFLNGWQRNPEHSEYLEAAEDIWEYIKEYVVDHRENSEWFWAVSQDGKPFEKPIVEPWKCPYHNGRMCIEVIRRTQNVA
ncbi:AGE family epimerase/isomerase [Mediterraneibacter glycyrrhizinilyticus]|uniref:AGE family epimerase/isomerase n=1 Tax=Mediterraneibacter glycyrrhizinilyticus TaxID=342942 RepID=UPI00265B236E|nr:AGE family epimerase/isomerase [Mediterraneibacter glycyrrhizinilyticus]